MKGPIVSTAARLNKAARIAYLALLLGERGVGRPRKQEIDTAAIAARLGVTQRSIQRDLHYAQQVWALASQMRERAD